MNTLLNKWYKNHALIYKILLFLTTTLFIVYLFPKTGKFKYSFEKGKPWQSENLYAPFNFAIKKAQSELDQEKAEIESSSPVYFELNTAVKDAVLTEYLNRFNSLFKDSIINTVENSNTYEKGRTVIEELYTKGVLDTDYNYTNSQPAIFMVDNTIEKRTEYGALIEISGLKRFLDNRFNTVSVKNGKNKMISLFFDIVTPNLTLNTSLTQKALDEELLQISTTRGSIEKGTLIISKGQVVEEEQYNILNSLKSEYESQVWNTANYNWVLVAYTLLVALALLMLLLFLRK